jgi:rhomboid family GlyGly-CTERM serine protease
VTPHTPRISVARSLNCDGRHGLVLVALALIVLAPLLGGDALRVQWRYERAAVAQGEWWRWVTAHFVHLGPHHAILNVIGLAMLWGLFARTYSAMQWLVACGITLATIDLGFWFLTPELEWYVGISALLHGIFACGCLALIKQRDKIGYVAAAIFSAKLAYEHWLGALPFERPEMVVTVSHLYGAIGGLIAGTILRPRSEPLYLSHD